MRRLIELYGEGYDSYRSRKDLEANILRNKQASAANANVTVATPVDEPVSPSTEEPDIVPDWKAAKIVS